jgi:ribosomal protein S18 acetylase RimI-like enzyme
MARKKQKDAPMSSSFRGRPGLRLPLVGVWTILSLLLLLLLQPCQAWTPPTLGLTALVFPVRGATLTPVSTSPTPKEDLAVAADFFVDAFWTAKVGGGAPTLSERQATQLRQSQQAEFTRRYGNPRRWGSAADFFMICNAQGEMMACAGVEVDRLRDGGNASVDQPVSAPVMSNLAVSRSYRRRGLAEDLVRAVEEQCRVQWGYDEVYLYVEERNRGAVRLYQKMGYKSTWKDSEATTLLPSREGGLHEASTTLVCMRKQLRGGRGLFGRLFSD